MINIFLFLYCLVNSLIVDGIQDPLLEDLVQLEKVASANFAGAILQPASGTSFYGVSGALSVFNPKVENKEQMSVSAIWVLNRTPNNFNAVVVGWHVMPEIYNDDKTHLFIYWASDNLKRGCHNLQCRGFIQVDKSITPGQAFNQTSTIDGLTIMVSLGILQDPKTKNWWIYVNEKGIGYYPASLFSRLTTVDQVAWYGKTLNAMYAPSPPMGSGVLPNGILGHACYFKDLAFVNNDRKQQRFTKDMGQIKTTHPLCYSAAYYQDLQTGLSLQFGGPGGGKCN
ncbi:unnamed protein product [Trifolium pratense]|uniref:Uncharacterized protein n=1 Tax=Trifolium pratense TaxID=57577 RepID=A0ACB0K8W1_TRIPR|nr:unnamed protein product [Trifolium pratense]